MYIKNYVFSKSQNDLQFGTEGILFRYMRLDRISDGDALC